MAEVIDLRGDSSGDEGDAPAAKRARTSTDKNDGICGVDLAPHANLPIARRDERGAMTAPPSPADAAPVPPPAAVDAAPRPKRRRPRRSVDLADAATALDTDTIKGWMRDRSAIVDVKRPRYDAVAAAPADPLAPRLAPAAAPERTRSRRGSRPLRRPSSQPSWRASTVATAPPRARRCRSRSRRPAPSRCAARATLATSCAAIIA